MLDEFHTYDGAQGTDVAMLLRRLGATLGMAELGRPLGGATPVATSATLGTGDTASAELAELTGKVFGVEFAPESVIGETRQTVDEACAPVDFTLPIPARPRLRCCGTWTTLPLRSASTRMVTRRRRHSALIRMMSTRPTAGSCWGTSCWRIR